MIPDESPVDPLHCRDTLQMQWHAGFMVLLIGGVLTVLSGYVLIRELVKTSGFQDIPWVLTPFLLVGIAIMGWGSGISARRAHNRIRSWHGIILPGLPPLALYWKNFDVGNIASIACYGVQTVAPTSTRELDGKGASYDCYIDLETETGELKTLVCLSDPAETRRAATRIALFFQVPLTVQAYRGELRLGPGNMTRISLGDLSLRWIDRQRRLFPTGKPELSLPVGRLSLETGSAGTRLSLPRARLRGECPLFAVIGLTSAAGATVSILQGINTAWFGFGLFLAICTTAALASSLLMAVLGKRRLVMGLDPAGVSFQWHYPGWRGRKKVITANSVVALEELPQSEGDFLAFYGPEGPVVRLLTEVSSLHFGWGLSDYERNAIILWVSVHLTTCEEKAQVEENH